MEANMTCTTILFIQYTRHNEKNSMHTHIPHTPPLLDNTSHGYALGHTNIFFVRQTSSEKKVRAGKQLNNKVINFCSQNF